MVAYVLIAIGAVNFIALFWGFGLFTEIIFARTDAEVARASWWYRAFVRWYWIGTVSAVAGAVAYSLRFTGD